MKFQANFQSNKEQQTKVVSFPSKHELGEVSPKAKSGYYTDLSRTKPEFWTGFPLNLIRVLLGLTKNWVKILHQVKLKLMLSFYTGWDHKLSLDFIPA